MVWPKRNFTDINDVVATLYFDWLLIRFCTSENENVVSFLKAKLTQKLFDRKKCPIF